MCMPVIPKNVAPKSGVEPGHLSLHSAGNLNGVSPSAIRWRHSNKCSTIKVAPRTAVARIHFRAVERFACAEAETAMTIVKLDDNSTNVMMEEKTMLGENLKGVGHTFDARTKAYPISSAENVNESDMM